MLSVRRFLYNNMYIVRRLRYGLSMLSLRVRAADLTIIVFWVIGPHESIKKYVFSRGHQGHTMLIMDCCWQHVELLDNSVHCCTSRDVMSFVLDRFVLYWCSTLKAYENPPTWYDLIPSLSLGDLFHFPSLSCAACIDDVRKRWSMRLFNFDHDISVFFRKIERGGAPRVSAFASVSLYTEALPGKLAGEVWMLFVPLGHFNSYVVFDFGGRLSRSYIIMLSVAIFCVVLLFCHQLHLLTYPSDPYDFARPMLRQIRLVSHALKIGYG